MVSHDPADLRIIGGEVEPGPYLDRKPRSSHIDHLTALIHPHVDPRLAGHDHSIIDRDSSLLHARRLCRRTSQAGP